MRTLFNLKMKFIATLAICMLAILNQVTFAQVGISSTSITADASAMLEVRSTTSGLLIPRMTTAQRDAIAAPVATGLLIYNTTTNAFNYYNGAWNDFTPTSFSGSLSGDVTGTQGATVVRKINGTSLSGLATGILKNTTGTGVPSIAVAGDFPTLNQNTTGTAANVTGTVAVSNGGTGLTTGTSGGILGFTAAGTLASSVVLTANQIVIGKGAGFTPTVLGSLGTTTTVLHGNAAGAPTFGSIVNSDITNSTIDLTTKVTGTLPVANGGTGQSTNLVQGGILYGSSTTAAGVTGAGTAGQFLQSNGTSAPTWAAVSATNFSGSLSGDVTGTQGATVVGNIKGVTLGTTTATSGNLLIGNGTQWNSTAISGDVTINGSGVTSIGPGKVTNAMLAGSIDLTTKVIGILPIANGGTNSTATPTNGGVGYGTGTAHAYTVAGTSGQYLQSNGAGSPTWGQPRPANVQVFSSGTSYTPASDVTAIIVEIVGGGGAGGGTPASNTNSRGSVGGGGGAGGYAKKLFLNPGTWSAFSYSVGSGGTGTSGAAGVDGGNTTFSTLTANGGKGGLVGQIPAAATYVIGGDGGDATGGDINTTGGAGGSGITSTVGFSGQGGNSVFGGGAVSVGFAAANTSTTGNSGKDFGAGGSGGCVYRQATNNQNATTGGAGYSGVIIIYEFK
jgi:hypothetical protein